MVESAGERREICRRAFALACDLLDPQAISQSISELADDRRELPEMLREALDPLASDESESGGVGPGARLEEAFEWFTARGATLLATLADGEVVTRPESASGQPGLLAWLEVTLERLGRYPGAQMTSLGPIPNAGALNGDVLLTSSGFGELGPTLVVFRRSALRDFSAILKVASTK